MKAKHGLLDISCKAFKDDNLSVFTDTTDDEQNTLE